MIGIRGGWWPMGGIVRIRNIRVRNIRVRIVRVRIVRVRIVAGQGIFLMQ